MTKIRPDKLQYAERAVADKIKNAIPPEQEVARRLYLYGITCSEFNDIKELLDISDPIRCKILNYLYDEYRNRVPQCSKAGD